MEIAIIVAMTPQGLIGKNNKIPWHLPADLQRFKKITMGHSIIMGRKTFESLPGLLPGRQHIVLTRNPSYKADGCIIVTNWAQIEILIEGKAFVIGGADIYNYALPIAKQLYTTIVYTELVGDTYFPDWNRGEWQEIEREFHAGDDENKFDVDNILYRRIVE
ncbi:MAG: dihydrofolate reductase [Desulfobulbia bacterium]